ncbi:MAG: glycosyltransferase [Acidobacteriota bacterium]
MADASPRASVVIPSYNHGKYIEEALASCLTTDLPVEVVVVDDGSTDDSVARIESFGDSRIRLFPQANAGAHAALSRGVSLAKAPVIFILNSDDAFEAGRIDRLLALFDDDPDLALAASWLRIVDGDGETLGVKEGWRNMEPWPKPRPGASLADLGDPTLALLETNYVATTSNAAFRRDLVSRRGLDFLPLRYAHDWDFLLGACHLGKMKVVEEPLVRYRVHGSNTISEGRDEGRGLMRFEILWLLARHARRVLRGISPEVASADELETRLWRSLPRFGAETLLLQLLALRGTTDSPPPAYDRLLDPNHPFRRAAVDLLAELEP